MQNFASGGFFSTVQCSSINVQNKKSQRESEVAVAWERKLINYK